MYKKINVPKEFPEYEALLKQWSREKTTSKAIMWAIHFALQYYPIIEQIKHNNFPTNSDSQ